MWNDPTSGQIMRSPSRPGRVIKGSLAVIRGEWDSQKGVGEYDHPGNSPKFPISTGKTSKDIF